MNTILDESDEMCGHTNLRVVFEALGGRQKEFKWLITDWECNYYPKPELAFTGSRRPVLISGERLTEIVYNDSIQFIWGVLSGFKPDEPIDVDDLVVEPYADGNPMFWRNHPQVQHPKAIVEIVCWDSTLTLLLSKDEDLSVRFRNFFRDAQDLDEYNNEQVYNHWLKVYIRTNQDNIPLDRLKAIRRHYKHREFKEAFTGLVLELMNAHKYPPYPGDWRWREMAQYYGPYSESSEQDFWGAFQAWLDYRKTNG